MKFKTDWTELLIAIAIISVVIMLMVASGCVSTTTEWLHDEDRNLNSDVYSCENIALQRQSNIGICTACGLNVAIEECLVRQYGWTRIVRSK